MEDNLCDLNREYKNFLRDDAVLIGEILDRNRPNSTQICYESFTDSCEKFTGDYVLSRAVYDSYKLFTTHLRKSQSVDTREKIFDMSKIGSPFTDPYQCLQVVPSYSRIRASYLYECLRLTTI